jgi:tetratricopeptide (TPR) repeat protein
MALLNELPYVRPDFFLPMLSRWGRRLFWGLWGVLLVGLVGLAWVVANPYALSVKIRTTAAPMDLHAERVTIVTHSHHQVEVPLEANAYLAFPRFAASAVDVQPWILWLSALFLSLAWGVWLGASSKIRKRFSNVIYVLFAVQVASSGVGGLLWPGDPFNLGTLAVLMLFLLPAYMFKEDLWQLRIEAQVLLFATLQFGIFGLCWLMQDTAGLHSLVTRPLALYLFLCLLTIAALSQHLVNLILLVTTQHANPGRRQPAALVFGLLGTFALFCVVLMLHHYGFIQSGFAAFHPLYLVCLAALVAPFTSQNAYFQVKDIVVSNLAYCLIWLGGGLLLVGVAGYHLAHAEYPFRAGLDRTAAYFFAVVGVLYGLYVAVNYGAEIRQRMLVYYALMVSRRMRFIIVWFIAGASFVFFEGQSGWLQVQQGYATHQSAMGDQFRLLGQDDDARKAYEFAADYARKRHPKAFYNTLQLVQDIPNMPLDPLRERYQFVENGYDFVPAQLNYSNLLLMRGLIPDAQAYLSERTQQAPHPYSLHNLGAFHSRYGNPDSAVAAWQHALQLDARQAVSWTSLGAHYHRFGRPDDAAAYLQEGVKLAPSNPYCLQNALALRLSSQHDTIRLPALGEIPDLEQAPEGDSLLVPDGYWYNAAWAALQQQNWAQADTLAGTLLRFSSAKDAPDYLMLRIQTDGARRGDALASNLIRQVEDIIRPYQGEPGGYPFYLEYQLLLHQQAAAFYTGQGVPEMAADHLNRAAAELPMLEKMSMPPTPALAQMRALEALSLLSAGYLEAGTRLLDSLLANRYMASPELRRERQLLDIAQSTDVEKPDYSWMTTPMLLRLGRYCGLNQNLNEGAFWMEQVSQRLDPTSIEPYRIAAKLYSRLADSSSRQTSALAVLSNGLVVSPASLVLQYDMAQVYLQDKLQKPAADIHAKMIQADSAAWLTRRLGAQLQLLTPKMAEAMPVLRQLLGEQPFDIPTTLDLLALLDRQNEKQAAVDLMAAATQRNPRNPLLWEAYARALSPMRMYDDVDFCYRKAVELARNADERQRMMAAYAAWQVEQKTALRVTPAGPVEEFLSN